MKECTIYHTGMGTCTHGIIKDKHVYLLGKSGELLLPNEFWCAKEECDNGLIQFEYHNKWGFADIYTGEIKIQPQWDYAAPFYGRYAHVASGVTVDATCSGPLLSEGGKHGYINIQGHTAIPLNYEDAEDCPMNNFCQTDIYRFPVKQSGKWGLIDSTNKVLISFEFDRINSRACPDMIVTGTGSYPNIKYGIYNNQCKKVIPPVLDKIPQLIQPTECNLILPQKAAYYLLKRGRKFGVFCNDGRIITGLTLCKKDAITLINKLCGTVN